MPPRQQILCKNCNSTFRLKIDYSLHLYTHHKLDLFQCTKCKLDFQYFEDLGIFFDMKELGEDQIKKCFYLCPLCEKSSERTFSMQKLLID